MNLDLNSKRLVIEPTLGYLASQQVHRPKKAKVLGFWSVSVPAPLPLPPADRGLQGSAVRLLSVGDTAQWGLDPL